MAPELDEVGPIRPEVIIGSLEKARGESPGMVRSVVAWTVLLCALTLIGPLLLIGGLSKLDQDMPRLAGAIGAQMTP